MASLLDNLYQHSPVWMQNIGVSLFGVYWQRRRYGGVFRQHVEAFKAREYFTTEEWQLYQTIQLRALLTYSMIKVPYYRHTFTAAGLTLSAIRELSLDDIVKLPLLEKNLIREQPDSFLAESSRHRKLHADSTSGSTGTPLVIRLSSETHQIWTAGYEARCLHWAGVDHTMSRAMIGGRLVVPQGTRRPPFWRYNAVEKQLYFSAFHIAPEFVPHYVAALNTYKPSYLVGYASSHYYLARMIEEKGLSVHEPRCILTGSEKLTEEMRATLERVYRCEVFDGYSGSENCCMATECSYHHLHMNPDMGICEIVDEKGMPVAMGETGEMVATGLMNYDQPLIRYRTGDLAIFSPEPCPCKRQMPVIKEIIGRVEDTIYSADGRQMVRFHGIFLDLPAIQQGQVIQQTINDFTVRLVTGRLLNERECQEIRRRMYDRLGQVNVRIEFVEKLERTSRGKIKAVVCELSPDEIARIRGKGA